MILGQTIVALVFAELASHFPVAGSIYQRSKRLFNRTLGWFTGWLYFWAQVVTVTAVAVIVAFVIDGIHGPVGDVPFLDSPDPTGITTMFAFISLATLVVTTLEVDFVGYVAERFDRLLANASTPAFERALREAAGQLPDS